MNPFSRRSRFVATFADYASAEVPSQFPLMALLPKSPRSAENAAWIDGGREIVAYSQVASDGDLRNIRLERGAAF